MCKSQNLTFNSEIFYAIILTMLFCVIIELHSLQFPEKFQIF